jgi:hypothetical protein
MVNGVACIKVFPVGSDGKDTPFKGYVEDKVISLTFKKKLHGDILFNDPDLIQLHIVNTGPEGFVPEDAEKTLYAAVCQ